MKIRDEVKAPGNRVLVRLEFVEKKETFEGSMIVKPNLTESRYQLEKEAVYKGYVVAIGPDAYSESSTPWCKLGDFVQISKYSGTIVDHDIEDGFIYRMVNDIDVHAVFPKKRMEINE